MKKIIYKARCWSSSLWQKAIISWANRQQDHNYRRYVVRPAIKQLISQLNFQPKIVVDLGCADGEETVFLKQFLGECGFNSQVYGFEPQSKLIAKAPKDKDIIFASGNFTRLVSKYKLKGKIDLLITLFVLQDLAELSSFFEHIKENLSETGQAVFLLVHPCFGQAMLKKSALIIEKSLSYFDNVEWQYASAYPIVEENGQTFWVPYFHRSVEYYLNTIKKYFQIISVKELKPDKQTLRYCQEQKVSPFVNHPGNVYYPEIINQASTLLIIAKRRKS